MDPRSVLTGGADGRFERIVHHLVTSGELVPRGVAADALLGESPRHRWLVAVLRDRPGALAEAERLLRAGAAAGADAGVEIALVGGGPEVGEALREAVEREPSARVHAWHVPDEGEPRIVAGGPTDGPLRDWLVPPDAPPDWDAFWAVVKRVADADREMRAFQEALQVRKPRATPILVGAIVAVYVLGLPWGAPDDIDALLRMGAFYGPAVRDGEVWRLLSSTFLHGSAIHLAFNAYVLWAIGSVVERIVGTARFLLIYVASGLGGGLLSLLFQEGVGVGASGAIWGLMTAELALVWRPNGLLPEALRARMRRGALETLVMNFAISFMPGIGWAAHFGGGIVGALLVFSGAVTRGLPRLAAGRKAGADEVPVAIRVGAWVAVLLLVGSLIAAFAVGRPWELAS